MSRPRASFPSWLLFLPRDFAILVVSLQGFVDEIWIPSHVCDNLPKLTEVTVPRCLTLVFGWDTRAWLPFLESVHVCVCVCVCVCVFSCQVMYDSLRPHGLQYASPPCPLPSPGVCPSSCPLSWWCHPIISSSVALFSFGHQSFPVSGSFLMSWLFAIGGQSIGVSASASALSMSIEGWFPLGSAGLISLLPKGLSRVFSRIQKRQFFSSEWHLAN